MHPDIRRTFLTVLSVLALATAEYAQIATPYTDNFDTGALPA